MRNCSYQALSPSPTGFSTCLNNFLPFLSDLDCHLQTCSARKTLKKFVAERVKRQINSLPDDKF